MTNVQRTLDSKGQGASTLVFLLFASTFLTLYGLYYFVYSESANKMEYQLAEIDFDTEATTATGQSIWTSEEIVFGDGVRVPINDLKELRDTYGEESNEFVWYTSTTFFMWRETFSLFEITIDHDSDVHAGNQLTVNITVYEPVYFDNGDERMTGSHGASWQNLEAPGYIHVGKTWFETYGLKQGDITNILRAELNRFGYYPKITTGWTTNVEIYISEITPSTSDTSTLEKIWGEVTLEWGTYAGSLGEIGWINTLGDLLTVNLPGIPPMIRIVFAVPILLCVGFITAYFIKQVFFSL